MANKPRIKDIEVRGVVYADVPDICKRLNVTRHMVYWRLKRGENDLIGLDVKLRIRVRETDYDGVNDCARELDVHPNSVYKALERGTLETLGLSKRKRTVKVTVLFGFSWISRSRCCADLHISHTTLDKVLKGKAPPRTIAFVKKRVAEYEERLKSEKKASRRKKTRKK